VGKEFDGFSAKGGERGAVGGATCPQRVVSAAQRVILKAALINVTRAEQVSNRNPFFLFQLVLLGSTKDQNTYGRKKNECLGTFAGTARNNRAAMAEKTGLKEKGGIGGASIFEV